MGGRAAYLAFVVAVLGVCGVSWGQQKASNPNPADGATNVVYALLQWTPGSGAVFHDVYLGTTPDLGPAQLVGPRWTQGPVFYSPVPLVPGTTYYWRVDEVEKDGVTLHTGDVWSFLAQPFTAFRPDPVDGHNEVALTPNLKWLAGQMAVKHHVYFGESEAAVAAGAAEVDKGTVTDPNYAPGALQPTTTYFWRVDEVGLGGSEVAGAVWSFTTILPVDDFESYNDDEGKGTRIYETWIDGYADNSSGSTVGNIDPPFAEQKIVHGGLQSMPMDYNNINAPHFSEAYREFDPAEDWTANDVNTLVLYVHGQSVDFEIPYVSAPPVLDGKVDEVWAQASVQYIKTTINGAAPTGPADCSGRFRVLYDTTYLYVLVDVNDATLVQDSDPAQGWLDDRVEVFIDGDNSKDAAQDGQNDYQYCFRWNHGTVEVPVEWYRSPGSLTGVQYATATTSSTYLMEIKLPWSTMVGGPQKAGRLIGIDVVIDDDDDGGDTMDTQMAWHLPTGDPHRPNWWGTALLAEAVAKPPDHLYVMLEDATTAKHKGVVTHADPEILKSADWVAWRIPLSDFADAGVNLTKVRKMYIGVGDRASPAVGGAGRLFVDDIYLAKPAPAAE